MHETSTPADGVTSETWRLRWDAVKRRCEELGGTEPEQIATLLGISRATLFRWKKGTHTPDMARAHRAETAIGLSREVMWERVSA